MGTHRKKALEWWNSLTYLEVYEVTGKYEFGVRRTHTALTGREIEYIYKKEHGKS